MPTAPAHPGHAGAAEASPTTRRSIAVLHRDLIAVCNSIAVHSSTEPRGSTTGAGDDLVDAVLGASRVLVAVAARSLAAATVEVTLPQYRALVVLASRGPQRVAELADALAVGPSTATRMCDRLVRKKLVRRHRPAADRRTVRIALTGDGDRLVHDVTAHRRTDISRIVRKVPAADRPAVVTALRTLAAAAGEVPEQDWATGWDL